MPELNKRLRSWTYAEARRTTPFVRLLLGSLRENFIAAWHFFRLNGYDAKGRPYRREVEYHQREGRTALGELQALGVLPYQSPARGIALFPFEVGAEQDGGSTGRRAAYLVYKDSRDRIDSYILADILCTYGDLHGHEKAVPEWWKEPGASPRLERESGSERPF